MSAKIKIICIIGPTASGKSARALAVAKERNGEVISVDSRQVYRGLDVGTEKMSAEEMNGIPHHLIDIREPEDTYTASEFVEDAERLIHDICARGKVPILAGGTHFYFDSLLRALPKDTPRNENLQKELERLSTQELAERAARLDPRRARELDPKNRRRLIRALEILETHGEVPTRATSFRSDYDIEWMVLEVPLPQLRERIDARLARAFENGLVAEVARVRERVGIERLSELGLEYRIVGEYLRGERTEDSLLPALSAKLWQYARRQRAWVRKLSEMKTS
jgi:tRNA dimethylallyltransferase